jgi:hypothetical protein
MEAKKNRIEEVDIDKLIEEGIANQKALTEAAEGEADKFKQQNAFDLSLTTVDCF